MFSANREADTPLPQPISAAAMKYMTVHQVNHVFFFLFPTFNFERETLLFLLIIVLFLYL